MTGVRKKSKYYGTKYKIPDYEYNPDRRVYIPEWIFTKDIVEFIEYGAEKNEVTRSRFFETVIKNYFLLNNTLKVQNRPPKTPQPKAKYIKLTIHPIYIDMIKNHAAKSNYTATRYLSLLFDSYRDKYEARIDISQLL